MSAPARSSSRARVAGMSVLYSWSFAPSVYADPFTGFISADGMMPGVASLLTAGLARNAGWSGDPSSPAADLRAKLTYLFTEHVHLFALVLTAIDAKGPHSALTKAAQAGLDANSAALITEIRSLSRIPPPKKGKPSPTPTPCSCKASPGAATAI